LDTWKGEGQNRIDTAARYPPVLSGASEKLLGSVKAAEQGFLIDTKILAGAGGSLTKDAIQTSFKASLERLGVEKVNTLYCHAPDYETPLKETAETFNELYNQGKFEKFGISNFTAAMVGDLLKVCDENGFVKPTVYQGRYNPIIRDPEDDGLLALCHEKGLEFVAYNAVAAGFFTGALTKGGEALKDSRYADGLWLGQALRGVYDKEAYHAAYRKVAAVIDPLGITGPATSVRWLCYHSGLKDGDGMIFGSSKPKQVDQNIEAIKQGPLPEEVVKVLEEIWVDIKTSQQQSKS